MKLIVINNALQWSLKTQTNCTHALDLWLLHYVSFLGGVDNSNISPFVYAFRWSGRGAVGRAWVFQPRNPAFDSWRITVVPGRASDLKCSCAT